MLVKDKLNALHEINEYIKSKKKKKYDTINIKTTTTEQLINHSNNYHDHDHDHDNDQYDNLVHTLHKRMNSNDELVKNTHINSSTSSKKSLLSSFNPLKKRSTKSSSNINPDYKID